MSTIVAVLNEQQVCIAADSLTSYGELNQTSEYDLTSDKILSCGKDSYIGIVGSAAHHGVMRHAIKHHSDLLQFNNVDAVYESFLRLHPILKEEYYLNPKDSEDDVYESSRIDALVISPAGIFGVYALREVFQYGKFWAIGAGSEVALGALFAASKQSNDAKYMAKLAIEASATFHSSTALPLTCYTVPRAV